MLYDVKSSVFFLTRALWLWTRLSHVYNLISQRDCDNHFSTWLFLYFSLPLSVCILYQLLSFLLWRCFEKKNRSDVKWLPFFNILENVSTSSEKKNSVGFMFWSILYELFFRGLCVVVVFGFDIACILVTRPSLRAKLFFRGFLRNSRKISSR